MLLPTKPLVLLCPLLLLSVMCGARLVKHPHLRARYSRSFLSLQMRVAPRWMCWCIHAVSSATRSSGSSAHSDVFNRAHVACGGDRIILTCKTRLPTLALCKCTRDEIRYTTGVGPSGLDFEFTVHCENNGTTLINSSTARCSKYSRQQSTLVCWTEPEDHREAGDQLGEYVHHTIDRRL